MRDISGMPNDVLWTTLFSLHSMRDGLEYAEEIVKRQNILLLNESVLFSLFHDAVKAIGPYELASRRLKDAPIGAPSTVRLSIRKADVQSAINKILAKLQRKKIAVVDSVYLVAKDAGLLVRDAVTAWYDRFCTNCHQEFPAESLTSVAPLTGEDKLARVQICSACWSKLAPKERSAIPTRPDMPENLGRMRFIPPASTTTVTSIPIDHKRARRGT